MHAIQVDYLSVRLQEIYRFTFTCRIDFRAWRRSPATEKHIDGSVSPERQAYFRRNERCRAAKITAAHGGMSSDDRRNRGGTDDDEQYGEHRATRGAHRPALGEVQKLPNFTVTDPEGPLKSLLEIPTSSPIPVMNR